MFIPHSAFGQDMIQRLKLGTIYMYKGIMQHFAVTDDDDEQLALSMMTMVSVPFAVVMCTFYTLFFSVLTARFSSGTSKFSYPFKSHLSSGGISSLLTDCIHAGS